MRSTYVPRRPNPMMIQPSFIDNLNHRMSASLLETDRIRWNSGETNPHRKGFMGNLIHNVKEKLEKNIELKKIVKKETLKSSQIVKAKLEELTDHLNKSMKTVKDEMGNITDVRMYSRPGGESQVSEVLTEIAKIDPPLDKGEWLRFCEKKVIPNELEAFIRG
ncbi:hypothetical protein KIN20_015799 [Parelaphostrongylus tenuis]|uniref:Uncharacterized protein n=1 Tax=Parelaphostrongylus tenuis TaxID=148309 RepID=A0AAD5MKA9_PARTN|nr:hypothetical protein KIN20_015799 [Parelaphostrongylus tenuis]